LEKSIFKLGQLEFQSQFIQGPLAGYSCSAFRELIWNYGGLAYACSEMLSAKDLVNRPKQPLRYINRAKNERYLCVQIAGHQPEILALAAQRAIDDLQADIIDLNCGCPKPKIRRKGYGSKLVENPIQLSQCVSAMREITTKPITVKIRLQKQLSLDRENIAAIEASHADAIIIHPRTWQEDYHVHCDWEYMKQCISSSTIPIIANGDIATLSDSKKIFKELNCAAMMVSRASTGKPWLFKQLSDPLFPQPDRKTIGQLLIQHVQKLAELEGNHRALLQSRTLIKYYARAANLVSAKQLARRQHARMIEFIQDVQDIFDH